MKSGSEYGPRCHGSYCRGTRCSPEVWLASWPSVTLRMSPPCCSSVTYLATGSSSATSPRLTACASSVEVNTLPTEARLNSASEVIACLRAEFGHAEVEEHGAAVDEQRHRHAGGREQQRLHMPGDEVAQLGVGLRPRRRAGVAAAIATKPTAVITAADMRRIALSCPVLHRGGTS